MTHSNEQPAPELGEPRDVNVNRASIEGGPSGSDVTGDDQTMDTPDELGGTGGEQAGGAG